MKKKNLYLILILVLGSYDPNSSAKDLTLEEAINLSLTQNKESLASKEVIQSSEYEAKASYAKLLPELSLEGKHTVLNDPITLDVGDVRKAMIASNAATLQYTGAAPATVNALKASLESALPSFNMNVQDKSYSNLSAVVTQPLFTGGKILANIHAKKEEVQISRELNKSTKDKIITDVVTGYYRIQLLKSLLSIKAELVADLKEHVSHADKLLRQGMISKANKLRADVALAEAEREHFKAQKDLEISYILLTNTLGTQANEFNLTTPMFTTNLNKLEDYLALGLGHNPNLQILSHKSKQLDDKHTAVQANFLPTFAAFGKYEIYKNDLTLFEPEWAVGIMMKMNLFGGGSDYNTLESINSQKMALNYYTENAKELIQTEIQKYYNDIGTAKEQLRSLDTTRSMAEENLRLNRLSFDQGVATSLEVIDAELSLGKVKTEQSKALYDYDVALVNLLRASGNCDDIVAFSKEVRN